MNEPDRGVLAYTVRVTAFLLVFAALLVVVGIFNETLRWDIFGPKVEAVLWGIFSSCLALASIGVALTFVLGVREATRSFRHLAGVKPAPESGARGVSFRALTLLGVAGLVTLVLGLSTVDVAVQRHRSKVFRRLAAEQVASLEAQLVELSVLPSPQRRGRSPRDLDRLLTSLESLSFVIDATVYLFDPREPAVLWLFSPGRGPGPRPGFEKIYVSRESEKLVRDLLGGEEVGIEPLNRDAPFTWYRSVVGAAGEPVAVLRIQGNPRENFREYFLGS